MTSDSGNDLLKMKIIIVSTSSGLKFLGGLEAVLNETDERGAIY
jgi:hypothetical protein